jgi:TrmH family RNA methyltransferase
VSEFVNKRITIPPYPQKVNTVESLNVAMATAIVCAEFRRRLKK